MRSLNYITLQVGNIETVKAWYQNVVGLSLEQETPGQIAVLKGDGGSRLCLEGGPPVSEPKRIDLLFEVEDVDAVYDRLRQEGVEFWRGPTNEVYGHRNAILFDPVGHKVEFFQYLATGDA